MSLKFTFRPLKLEIYWRVWGTPATFNGFRVLAALLHGTLYLFFILPFLFGE